MKKTIVKVPEGTKFLSDWDGFFEAFPPYQHVILNKKCCGCGATEAFLRTDRKVILASPRKHLLYDKFKQHLPDNFHLYRWNDDRDKYFNSKPNEKQAIQFDKNLKGYLQNGGRKILVPYDSIAKIINALKATNELLQDWIVVVDEFQAIFADCSYKADTERQFMSELCNFPSVIYLSATPFLEEYLDDVTLFNSIPMVELEWPLDIVEKPRVVYTELKNSSINKKCSEIIAEYREGNGPRQGDIQSKEAVFFINNVREIKKIVGSNNLTPEETNILCSATEENMKRLADIGHKLGDIPDEGQPHKMFTFCTSTVYLGADFYSTNACTYIFADPKIKSMAVDVSIDLQQILGRQRLKENPFRNSATLFFNTKAGQSKEEFDKAVQEKKEETRKKIENYNSAPNKDTMIGDLKDNIKKYNHSNHYCSLVEDADHNYTVEENELLIVSEKRAWEIANKIYQNDYSMYSALITGVQATARVDSKNEDMQTLYDEWVSDGSFERKAQLYCKMYNEIPEVLKEFSGFIPPKYKAYHDAIGEDGMKANKWREADIRKAIEDALGNIDHAAVYSELIQQLEVGKQYTRDKVKSVMKGIYKKLNIYGNPSASDVMNYITVKERNPRKNGKRVVMYGVVSHNRRMISLFPKLGDTDKVQNWDMDDVLNIIRTASYFHPNDKVTKVRRAQTESAKAKAKKQLPLVTWNGVFSKRGSEGLQNYSSFTAMDFDKIDSDQRVDELKAWLMTFDCVYAIFKTPSGKGLKAIILHDNLNPTYHFTMYEELLKKFDCPEIDTTTKDIGRGHYLSYDPDIWLNPTPQPYHFNIDTTISPVGPKETQIRVQGEDAYFTIPDDDNAFLNKLYQMVVSDERIIHILKHRWTGEVIQKKGRNDAAMSYAGILCLAGVKKATAKSFIESLIPNFDITEIMDYAYKENPFGVRRRNYIKKK